MAFRLNESLQQATIYTTGASSGGGSMLRTTAADRAEAITVQYNTVMWRRTVDADNVSSEVELEVMEVLAFLVTRQPVSTFNRFVI